MSTSCLDTLIIADVSRKSIFEAVTLHWLAVTFAVYRKMRHISCRIMILVRYGAKSKGSNEKEKNKEQERIRDKDACPEKRLCARLLSAISDNPVNYKTNR